MKILQLTAHFAPNVGGVETHLSDLVKGLAEKGQKVFVLTYQPLSTKTDWKIYERAKNIRIVRIPWLAGYFYKFVEKPALEFLYLSIGLFVTLPFAILYFDPQVIHSHGIVAGFAGVFWGKFFGRRVIISTHSIYHFPKNGIYREFTKLIFSNADKVLCLSKQSMGEVRELGVDKQKIGRFTYWVDLKKFRPINKAVLKKKFGWTDKFVVLFVGRLVKEKGILELLNAAKMLNKNVLLVIAGSGPLEGIVKSQKEERLIFIGKIENDKLPQYYSAADLLIVPSIHDEGFGRVILESLACGTPVIGSKRGAIPEAMNETVGEFLEVSPDSIAKKINLLNMDETKLKKLAKNAREYAVLHYSFKNIDSIIANYYAQNPAS